MSRSCCSPDGEQGGHHRDSALIGYRRDSALIGSDCGSAPIGYSRDSRIGAPSRGNGMVLKPHGIR